MIFTRADRRGRDCNLQTQVEHRALESNEPVTNMKRDLTLKLFSNTASPVVPSYRVDLKKKKEGKKNVIRFRRHAGIFRRAGNLLHE